MSDDKTLTVRVKKKEAKKVKSERELTLEAKALFKRREKQIDQLAPTLWPQIRALMASAVARAGLSAGEIAGPLGLDLLDVRAVLLWARRRRWAYPDCTRPGPALWALAFGSPMAPRTAQEGSRSEAAAYPALDTGKTSIVDSRSS